MGRSVRVYFFSAIHTCFSSKRQFWAGPVLSGTGAVVLEEIPRAITQTMEGVDRVAAIVRAMKEFAHPESKEMALADLHKALRSTITVARNEWKYVAEVETDFADLPSLSAMSAI